MHQLTAQNVQHFRFPIEFLLVGMTKNFVLVI